MYEELNHFCSTCRYGLFCCGAIICSNVSCEHNENVMDFLFPNCDKWKAKDEDEVITDQTVFSTGSVRDAHENKGRMDLLPWNAIIELSKHCERGALHYGENNVRVGIPFHSLADSGARHLANYISGNQDEPTHLVAACWNLMWMLEQTITKPELNDLPWVNTQKGNANGEN